MKKLFIFSILSIFLFSCYNENQENSKKAFKQGKFMLETIDSSGNIDYATALPYFAESIALYKGSVESYFWKSQCELHCGLLDEAIATSKAAIEIKHHNLNPQFHLTIGLVEKIRGNNESANQSFDQTILIYDDRIKDDNDDIDAIMNKAIVLCYADKKDAALTFLYSIKNKENETDIDELLKSTTKFNADSVLKSWNH